MPATFTTPIALLQCEAEVSFYKVQRTITLRSVELAMIQIIKTFLTGDEGATAVEYAVLLALILMAVIGAIGTVGAETGGLWGRIDSDLADTTFGG